MKKNCNDFYQYKTYNHLNVYEMYFNSSINFMIMSVIFDQGSKPRKIPLLPFPPKPHYFLCMFPYDFQQFIIIYVNFKFDLLDNMDLKRHILMFTLICTFSCSCRWLGERSEVSQFWKGIQIIIIIIIIITPLQEQLDRLKPQTLQINPKEHSLSLLMFKNNNLSNLLFLFFYNV